jgi:hypothetical protein
LYVPIALPVFRLFDCDVATSKLSADPRLECWGPWHTTATTLSLICVVPLLVGLPWVLLRLIRQSLVYQRQEDHEKRLQVWEIQHILRIDSFYYTHQTWLLGSYRLSAAFDRVWVLLLKLCWMVFYAALRSNHTVQASLMLATLLVYVVGSLRLWKPWRLAEYMPFRVASSNLVFVCLCSMLLLDAALGTANAANVTNALTISSTQTIFMLSYHCLGLAVITGSMVLAAVVRSCYHRRVGRFQWPTALTMARIAASRHCEDYCLWVRLLREAAAVRFDCIISAPEAADIRSLEESLASCQAAWTRARRRGSIFTILLSDMLDSLVRLHDMLVPVALRSKASWDDEFAKSIDALAARDKRLKLATSTKRRILIKLLAVRAFVSKRDVDELDFIPERHLTKQEADDFRQLVLKETELTSLLIERLSVQLGLHTGENAGIAAGTKTGDEEEGGRAVANPPLSQSTSQRQLSRALSGALDVVIDSFTVHRGDPLSEAAVELHKPSDVEHVAQTLEKTAKTVRNVSQRAMRSLSGRNLGSDQPSAWAGGDDDDSNDDDSDHPNAEIDSQPAPMLGRIPSSPSNVSASSHVTGKSRMSFRNLLSEGSKSTGMLATAVVGGLSGAANAVAVPLRNAIQTVPLVREEVDESKPEKLSRLGSFRAEQYVNEHITLGEVEDALEFWEEIVSVEEQHQLPGTDLYSDSEKERWYFFVQKLGFLADTVYEQETAGATENRISRSETRALRLSANAGENAKIGRRQTSAVLHQELQGFLSAMQPATSHLSGKSRSRLIRTRTSGLDSLDIRYQSDLESQHSQESGKLSRRVAARMPLANDLTEDPDDEGFGFGDGIEFEDEEGVRAWG